MSDKFYDRCSNLSEADILNFDKVDNGPINNVLIDVVRHSYSISFTVNVTADNGHVRPFHDEVDGQWFADMPEGTC